MTEAILPTVAGMVAQVWDTVSGKQLGDSLDHDTDVYDARFSPDGRIILTVGMDNTTRIWEAHLQTMSMKDLVADACVRFAGMSKLTREEMRLAGYSDSVPEIDVCTSTSGQ